MCSLLDFVHWYEKTKFLKLHLFPSSGERAEICLLQFGSCDREQLIVRSDRKVYPRSLSLEREQIQYQKPCVMCE
jgi:hypothetical protein